MSELLEPPFTGRDPANMLARIEAQGAHIDEALERNAASAWGTDGPAPKRLAVGAMGGSAIAADLTADLYVDRLPHPLMTVRDYQWPAWARTETRCVLSSYSGNTEETLSLYEQARALGAPRAAISSGGTLVEWCRRDQVPVATVPGGSPPRAALFGSWVALTGLLFGLGWIPDPAPEWRRAAQGLRAGAVSMGGSTPERDNPAKRLARALHRRRVYLYAGSAHLGAAATRFRNQLNENAKLLGHSAVVPELNHNEIVGWELPDAAHREAVVVMLRDDEESAPVSKRCELTAEFATARGAAVHQLRGAGSTRLERLTSIVQQGDFASYYLALLSGTDPTPVGSIDEFKRRLQAS
ncbi:MAG: bifunctional phosphoglucose/phosphomannose isomerase [Candidatus Eiseniibacteriota bacterium]